MAEAFGALRWHLEISGVDEGTFREVSGLDSEHEVIEHRVTGKGGNLIAQKVPGALKYSNIVLKRGITDSVTLQNWRKQIEDGFKPEHRKNGSITCYAPDNTTVIAKYSFINAWPCKFRGPALQAGSNDITIEEFELAHEKLTRDS